MMPRLGLHPDHERIVRDILSQRLPAGVTVLVFGSRAKGAPKPYSDLDLALKGGDRLPLAALADLAEAFCESDLPFKVDVVDWRSAGSGLQQAIDRDGVELSSGRGFVADEGRGF
jgi:predicted nucleotidyltransferase